MLHPLTINRTILFRLTTLLFSIICMLECQGQAQCVSTGIAYTYHISGSGTYNYCVTNGTVSGRPNCGTTTGTTSLQVTWNTGATSGSITYGSGALLTFTMASALVVGSITAGGSQTIYYNTTPATISCSAASGGICSGGTTTYSYQWYQSTDNITYSAVSGATSQNFTASSAITQTTYYKRWVFSSTTTVNGYSGVATVFVYPQLNGGVVSPSVKAFTYNTSPGTLTLTGVSGGDGTSYTYQWQSSTDSVTWSNVGSTSTTYTPGALTATTYFRAVVTNHSVPANSVPAKMMPETGTITPAIDSVLYNTSPGQLRVTGVYGSYSTNAYQWQSSPDSSIWTNITNAVDTVFTPLLLTSTTYYRVAISLNGGPTLYSFPGKVVVKIPTLIVGKALPAYQLVNIAGATGVPMVVQSVTGGACSGVNCYVYQWQQLNSSTWTNISGANIISLPIPTITATSYFRLQVSVGLQTAYSNVDTIGFENDTLNGLVNVWTGQTANYFRFTVLEDTTKYNWTCVGCSIVAPAFPNGHKTVTAQWTSPGNKSITVTVFGGKYYTLGVNVQTLPLAKGAIGIPILNVETGQPFSLNCSGSYGGNCLGVYTYQWQQSTDSINYTDITYQQGSNLPTTYAVASQNNYYRRRVIGGSDTAYSDTAHVVSFPILMGGTISYASTDSLPWNTAPTLPITGTAPTGGIDTNYTYQWYSSTQGEIIEGGQLPNYQPPASQLLATSVSYYRQVTCEGLTANSNTIIIPVKIVIYDPGTLSPPAQSVSSGTVVNLTGTAANGGTVATYSYQWRQSYDEVVWTNISGGNAQNYTTPGLTKTTYFRRYVTNGVQSAYSNVPSYYNEVKIKVVGTTGLNAPNTVTQSTASGSITAVPVNSYTLSAIIPTKINYVRNWEVEKPGVTTLAAAKGLTTVSDYKQSTTYLDDLGREIQTVVKQATPDNQDLISVVNYDPLGRVMQQYLPYYDSSNTGNFRTNPTTAQPAFYNSFFNNQEGFYYSNNIYDGSPENRVLKTTVPGNSWTGNNIGVRKDYTFNTTQDSVYIWKIGTNLTDTPRIAGQYAPGTLKLLITTDEQENKVMEYKDMEGKTILKKVELSDTLYAGYTGWLSTYYVYDVFNQLRYVLSPKAVQYASVNGWNLNPTVRNELCFQYNYDQARKILTKRVPGAGEVDMVYDARNRVVMTQDSLLRAQNEWTVAVFDSLDRPVKTALFPSANNRVYHQNLANTSITYPTITTADSALTETFYDDYSWESRSDISISQQFTTNFNNSTDLPVILSGAYAITPAVTLHTRGVATGKRVKILNNNQYLNNASFYDDYNRLTQVQVQNISAGWDTLTTQYDFSGKVLSSCATHSLVSTVGPIKWNMLVSAINYDAQGRPLSTKQYLNGSTTAETINTITYDKLGRLSTKALGAKPVETLTYNYTIRGWLKGINRNYVSGGSTSNWFGEDIGYDYGYNLTQLNGNIAGVSWISKGDPVARAYGYAYDNANRLVKGDFTQNEGSGYVKDANIDFNVDSLQYDANGNILKMQQKGIVLTSSAVIDHLQYGYLQAGGWSNRLASVTDNSGNTAPLGDFKDGTNTGNDYAYDGNGNLVVDSNKNISNISYNILNLPQTISIRGKGTVNYLYDATGTKWKKITLDSTATPVKTTTTTYTGAYVYHNDTLQFIGDEEGRIRVKLDTPATGYTPSNLQYVYDYFIKDHLGNTRMVLSEETQQDTYAATMEQANATVENALFDSVSSTQFAKPTGFDTDTSNHYVSRLNASSSINKRVGPAIILKVMAGDTVTASTYGWYNAPLQVPTSPPSLLNSLLPMLATSAIGLSGGELIPAEQTGVNAAFAASLPTFLSAKDADYAPTSPKAFLNWALFDDRMNYVTGGVTQVPTIVSPAQKQAMAANLPTTIPKNGYLYIYVSNESAQDVFFDNVTIQDKRGPLLEETHYYPFGLTMAGISDKALKTNYAENKYRYNDGTELANKEFSDGSGLELYETDCRSYDPQLGRFWQTDPLADLNEGYSPYSFANDNPILLNDPLGLANDSTHDSGVTPMPDAVVTAALPCKSNCGASAPTVTVDPPPSTIAAPIQGGSSNSKDNTASQDQGDHNIGTDIVYELNRFNPLAQAYNLVDTWVTGHDSYDVKQNTGQAMVNLAASIPVGRLSSTIVNVTADIGLAEVRQGIASTFANTNSISHILASKHNLGLLLSKAGSEANIIRRLYLSLGQTGSLPASGVFEKVVSIYGYDVTIRGAVVNGVPRIGTAFIP